MTLRILADENIPGDTVNALRRIGYDVVWVRTSLPGSLDEAVLKQAQVENRILITFDKDFGELAFRRRMKASNGVILLRITTSNPVQTTSLIVSALQSRIDWYGYFSVIENDCIRMTPL